MTTLPAGCSHLPQLFGEPGRELMGYFHPPRGGAVPAGTPAAADRVAILASPLGHEHIRCHRTFWRLADQLARAGLGVLRFDCLGLGDSALESDDVRLEDWVESVERAGARALELSGARRLDFVGLRLGASLGALAAARGRTRFDRLVLWQPVVRGRALVEELRADHRAFAESLGASVGTDAGQPEEFLGYRYQPALVRELEAIDLEQQLPASANEVVLLETAETASCSGLAQCLEGAGLRARHEHLPDAEVWLAEPYKQVMPHESIRAIVGFLTGERS